MASERNQRWKNKKGRSLNTRLRPFLGQSDGDIQLPRFYLTNHRMSTTSPRSKELEYSSTLIRTDNPFPFTCTLQPPDNFGGRSNSRRRNRTNNASISRIVIRESICASPLSHRPLSKQIYPPTPPNKAPVRIFRTNTKIIQILPAQHIEQITWNTSVQQCSNHRPSMPVIHRHILCIVSTQDTLNSVREPGRPQPIEHRTGHQEHASKTKHLGFTCSPRSYSLNIPIHQHPNPVPHTHPPSSLPSNRSSRHRCHNSWTYALERPNSRRSSA